MRAAIFFFQAEDGIRDLTVTGVQTCALPIFRRWRMTDLQVIRPAGRVRRIGRMPDPWAWPPWEAQHSDNTFGNRWDDPEGVYRVVYACSQLEGAYVEVLSRLRPDPAVLAGLAEIDGPDPEYRVGIVPASWLTTRAVGEAMIRGDYADIGHAASLTYLRTVMAGGPLLH